MAKKATSAALQPLIQEFCQVSQGLWSEASRTKHRADFQRYVQFLVRTGRPLTVESLDLTMLLAYVEELSTTPIARGVWRGDRSALAAAAASAAPGQTRSRNTINSYMRPLRSLCTYLMSEGVLTSDPFIRAKRRGGGNPLLPSEETPAKGSTLNDLECLRRRCTGKDATTSATAPIIELMITTGARAGSICKVRMEDLDLERGRVRFARAKGGKTYEAILQPEARPRSSATSTVAAHACSARIPSAAIPSCAWALIPAGCSCRGRTATGRRRAVAVASRSAA